MQISPINNQNNVLINGQMNIKGAKYAQTLRSATSESSFFKEKSKTGDRK